MDQQLSEQSSDSNAEPGSDTPGGQKPEKVEDRPNVSTVKPEDYPEPAKGDAK